MSAVGIKFTEWIIELQVTFDLLSESFIFDQVYRKNCFQITQIPAVPGYSLLDNEEHKVRHHLAAIACATFIQRNNHPGRYVVYGDVQWRSDEG